MSPVDDWEMIMFDPSADVQDINLWDASECTMFNGQQSPRAEVEPGDAALSWLPSVDEMGKDTWIVDTSNPPAYKFQLCSKRVLAAMKEFLSSEQGESAVNQIFRSMEKTGKSPFQRDGRPSRAFQNKVAMAFYKGIYDVSADSASFDFPKRNLWEEVDPAKTMVMFYSQHGKNKNRKTLVKFLQKLGESMRPLIVKKYSPVQQGQKPGANKRSASQGKPVKRRKRSRSTQRKTQDRLGDVSKLLNEYSLDENIDARDRVRCLTEIANFASELAKNLRATEIEEGDSEFTDQNDDGDHDDDGAFDDSENNHSGSDNGSDDHSDATSHGNSSGGFEDFFGPDDNSFMDDIWGLNLRSCFNLTKSIGISMDLDNFRAVLRAVEQDKGKKAAEEKEGPECDTKDDEGAVAKEQFPSKTKKVVPVEKPSSSLKQSRVSLLESIDSVLRNFPSTIGVHRVGTIPTQISTVKKEISPDAQQCENPAASNEKPVWDVTTPGGPKSTFLSESEVVPSLLSSDVIQLVKNREQFQFSLITKRDDAVRESEVHVADTYNETSESVRSLEVGGEHKQRCCIPWQEIDVSSKAHSIMLRMNWKDQGAQLDRKGAVFVMRGAAIPPSNPFVPTEDIVASSFPAPHEW
eukprot:CAMPEP_0203744866 /NCGR_PEP_ID=MMETSP0098-20131031/790_1 /ASSEMBLY_ACC=CAM_ASM_000208 /TAXON_ID=96639 /ORGANISM=" , Strain NY0313808BC1" /LENGTH=633 /DNA_ID=CAMNT_0050632493 /DNA_START=428 /DNA_END=2326 /DNA_ORIENTATION=-